MTIDDQVETACGSTVGRKTRECRDRPSEFARETSGHHRSTPPSCLDDEEVATESCDQSIAPLEVRTSNLLVVLVRTHDRASCTQDRIDPIFQFGWINSVETRRQEDDGRSVLPETRDVRALIDTPRSPAHYDRVGLRLEERGEMPIHPIESSRRSLTSSDDGDASRWIECLGRSDDVQESRGLLEFEETGRVERMKWNESFDVFSHAR